MNENISYQLQNGERSRMTNKLLAIIDTTWWIHCTNEQRERLKGLDGKLSLNKLDELIEITEDNAWTGDTPLSSCRDDSLWKKFVQQNQPRSCRFWDAGWCYHDDSPKNGECVGVGKCQIWEER